jgi:hypothetical protein
MRVLVCGSRTWDRPAYVDLMLSGLLLRHESIVVISGMAKGADIHAAIWAKQVMAHGGLADLLEFPANWDRDGKAAGPIRNQLMLDEGKPDLVLAFCDDILNSKGTRHMVTISQKAGVPTMVIGRPTL